MQKISLPNGIMVCYPKLARGGKPMTQPKSLSIVYKNWRGEVSSRNIMPIKVWYGSTDWYQTEQWFLKAQDLDKQVERDFAMCDIIKCGDDPVLAQKSANQS